MYERISLLVDEHGAFFQAWETRYGMGVWACLGLTEIDLDEVRDSTSDGDMAWIAALQHLTSADWLPIGMGATLLEAMTKLEQRLSLVPVELLCRESAWSAAVLDAWSNFRQARIKASKRGETTLTVEPLPPTLKEALEVRAHPLT